VEGRGAGLNASCQNNNFDESTYSEEANAGFQFDRVLGWWHFTHDTACSWAIAHTQHVAIVVPIACRLWFLYNIL
jgi:hypothetical protein